MTDAQKYQLYSKLIKGCFFVMKITLICAVAALAALVIFMGVSAGIGLNESDPQSFLMGVVVCAGATVVFLITAIACLLTATLTLNKLKKLDMREARD